MDHRRRERFEAEALVHLRTVYNVALRLARREEDAHDLSQETMLRAFRTFDNFTAGTNARAWLLTILYSVFVNRYHRARRSPERASLADMEAFGVDDVAAVDTVPLNPFASQWTEVDIADAMAALPDLFRETVLLVDVEELSYEEASQVMGCAVGTVRSRLHRARRMLAIDLQDYARRHRLVAPDAEPT